MTFSLFFAFVLMSFVCCLNVMPLSSVTPRILVVGVTGIGELLSVTCGLVLYSKLYGVMRVSDDLLVETFILLWFNQFSRV